MFNEHPSFQAPANPNVSIWRYMDLTKFLWMLQEKALFFTRSDFLGDPYEGHYTEAMSIVEEHHVAMVLGGEKNSLQEAATRENFRQIRERVAEMKRHLFVNCWHMIEAESSAMWKLYTSHHQSVCIKSNYRLLADLLPDSCKLGCVRYIDYRTDLISPGNALNYITCKRRSFEHERELRAVIWDIEGVNDANGVSRPKFFGKSTFRSDEEIGKVVPIAVEKLITSVLVSPDSDDLLLDVVQKACDHYELQARVIKSGVNAPPPY
jgi:hypothetical protein